MARKLDLTKTQFLLDPSGKLRAFRRKSAAMIFRDGKPERVCSWKEWSRLENREALTYRNVWTLVEVFLDAEA